MATPGILFLHQNFPGQFRHIAALLARDAGWNVVGLGEERPTTALSTPGVQVLAYRHKEQRAQGHPYLQGLESRVRRGQTVVRALLELRKRGFTPDIVCVHPSWGEALFVREVFPSAKVVSYCEFYYHGTGSDVGFDPEWPSSSLDDLCHLRMRNVTNLMALVDCDRGWSPTRWQAAQYPVELRDKINVIHDGVDTSHVCPAPGAVFHHGSLRLTAADTVLTYVARNLEPYRGFHVFMRALPEILRENPDATVVIVGGDEVSYGKPPPGGGTWREKMLKELDPAADLSRVHFTGKLPYKDFLTLLQVSTTHVYLTYPFVLSWSMLEAMSAGCLLVASNTAPVTEVIEDGVNGLLTDFFDVDALASTVTRALTECPTFAAMRARARETVIRDYDLARVCVPRQVEMLQSLL